MSLASTLGVALYAVSYSIAVPGQAVDVHALIKPIRVSAEAKLPEWTHASSGEFGPGRSGSFFFHLKRAKDELNVNCEQH